MMAVITEAGVAASLASRASGYTIKTQLVSYVIGDGFNVEPTGKETTIYGNEVYSGTIAADMTVSSPNASTVVFTLELDPSIGDFQAGNIGLFDSSGTLFAILVYTAPRPKQKDNLPSVAGNTLVISMALRMAGMGSALNLSLIPKTITSLPVAISILDLPAAGTLVDGLYVVSSNSQLSGRPSLSYSNGTSWSHIPLSLLARTGADYLNAVASVAGLPAATDAEGETFVVKSSPNGSAGPALAHAKSGVWYYTSLTEMHSYEEDITSNKNLTVQDANATITNLGATGNVVAYLPVNGLYNGMKFKFFVASAHSLLISFENGRAFIDGNLRTVNVSSSAVGSYICLEYIAGAWVATSISGTWASV